MKNIKISLIITILLLSTTNLTNAWNGDIHRGISQQSESQNNIIDTYLKTINITGGVGSEFELQTFILYNDPSYPPKPDLSHPFSETIRRIEEQGLGYENTQALKWLVTASENEDDPLSRARHHFHDPTTLNGLDNLKDPDLPFFLTPFAKGAGAREWAFEHKDMVFF